MFIKSLEIFTADRMIRDIHFHSGLNLIVDDTPSDEKKKTGNNVGKTTVIELVDFCFGTNPSVLYKDKENQMTEYEVVKKFLTENDVHVKTTFTDDLFKEDTKTIIIERNFLQRSKAVRLINGQQIADKDFDAELLHCFYPDQQNTRPTFRQLVSHNLRYREENLEKTIKTLDKFATMEEYETLNLYLFGCSYSEGEKKQQLIEKLKGDITYLAKLTRSKSKAAYESGLTLINKTIDDLNKRRESLGLDEDFKKHVAELDGVKYKINKLSAVLSRLRIKKQLIEEAVAELEKQTSHIDLGQLKDLYAEVSNNISGIQKTFDDLVNYHNTMIQQKTKYISSDFPEIIRQIQSNEDEINTLLSRERELSAVVRKHETFGTLEEIINNLNDSHRMKGEYEGILEQIKTAESTIADERARLTEINDSLFSKDFDAKVEKQKEIFNSYFSQVSKTLYDEIYYITKEVHDKKGIKLYDFQSSNMNLSTGKKQGEILCFDLAYILFARKENIPCMEFLMNDKKELLHSNQLQKVSDFALVNTIQLILPILKDKVPGSLLTKDNIVLELSQDDKLFRIEEMENAYEKTKNSNQAE